MGYFQAKQASSYSSRSGVDPTYYYKAAHSAYYGPWYHPAPLVKPPPYNPYKSVAGYAKQGYEDTP